MGYEKSRSESEETHVSFEEASIDLSVNCGGIKLPTRSGLRPRRHQTPRIKFAKRLR